ncbi:hypothetical protein QBC44DRAFT_51746 [Cladorrhinum sp. PSN332]|nr:hypothetical protein QBC44DRAFT_51746 [Cladorrhinum sp. PSN332]
MTGNSEKLIRELGDPVEDPEEETFDLFSQSLPSQNLGFIDSKAQTLDLTIAGRDLTIHQSPAVLSSNRAGGTTGAVVWKISPLFSEFISSPSSNPLFTSSILSPTSNVIELGCGISALVGLLLAPKIGRYVLTDQPYVSKLVEQNIAENHSSSSTSSSGKKSKSGGKKQSSLSTAAGNGAGRQLVFKPLDWEQDEVSPNEWGSYDAVIACDCIYNDALINPLVETCVDICRLRQQEEEETEGKEPTVCVIAQQLRDDTVFEGWLKKFMEEFVVWRVKDEILPKGLRSTDGFVVHFAVLRDEYNRLDNGKGGMKEGYIYRKEK